MTTPLQTCGARSWQVLRLWLGISRCLLRSARRSGCYVWVPRLATVSYLSASACYAAAPHDWTLFASLYLVDHALPYKAPFRSWSQVHFDRLQRDLKLSKQQRADLNAARQEYLAELGTNIKERQEVLDVLHECLPSGNGGKQTAARWALKGACGAA